MTLVRVVFRSGPRSDFDDAPEEALINGRRSAAGVVLWLADRSDGLTSILIPTSGAGGTEFKHTA
jgi:hypothetical protein